MSFLPRRSQQVHRYVSSKSSIASRRRNGDSGAGPQDTGEEDPQRDDPPKGSEDVLKQEDAPQQNEKPSTNDDPKGSAELEGQPGGDDGPFGDNMGLPPLDIPVTPGQLLRFVLRPTEEEKAAARKKIHPQLRMNKFWKNFEPDYEGGVTQILPETLVHKAGKKPGSKETTDKSVTSYQGAREQCIKSVNRIIRECRALNQKYTDIHFDVERDLKLQQSFDCLYGLDWPDDIDERPQDVKRVSEIFEKPEFYRDGATFDDILQGASADCWFLAALSALTANQQLIENICVIRDEEIGVYGFVFHRDGEWQPCIVDDKLYLKAPSFEESGETILTSYSVRHQDQEKKYRETFQTGSKALYFAACRDENETWVPLLEKAYAKAHGDYAALGWGKTGEALEDLTGGVSTEIYSHNILNKDRFWKDNLSHIGKDYIFSCATAPWLDSRDVQSFQEHIIRESRRKGVESRHAYSVLDTYEGQGKRLVKVRNPWGEKEWSGAWSDGSKEWTSEWVNRLNHKFGDDGVFWISYEDLLQRYRYLDCTKVFGPEWHITQQWAQVQVPWNIKDYQQTNFTIDVPTSTEAVIVLSQLDDRYFRGFEGEYVFRLQFRLQRADEPDEDEYIIRSKINYNMQKSTNVEIHLDPGKYVVLFKIEALESGEDDIETVIRNNIANRKNKVTQIATLYDLAHKKGQPPPKAVEKEKADTKGDTQTKDKLTQIGAEEQSKKDQSESKLSESSQQKVEAGTQTQDETASQKGTVESKQEAVDEKTEHAGTEGPEKVIIKTDKPKAAEEKATQTEVEKANEQVTGPNQDGNPPQANEDDDEDDPQRNPWNAFCTVGLRVYSKVPDLKVDVARPDEEQPAVLDGEDIAKAALVEAEAAAPIATEKDKEAKEKPEEAKEKTEEPKQEVAQSSDNPSVE